MDELTVARLRPLLEAPAPAVLVTTRADGRPHVTPVWFGWDGAAFEVVIAEGDAKLRHLRRDPQCTLLVFEATPPFRGVEVRGEAELVERDVTEDRAAIAGRYLGVDQGRRFAEERRDRPGVLVRLTADGARAWDLARILPDD